MSDSFPPIPLPGTELRTLHSENVGETYRLFIYLPWEYEKTEDAYPVLYATDGNLNFYRDIWSLPTVPPMIVVGIGNDSDDYLVHLRSRFRDYFVTDDQVLVSRLAVVEQLQVEVAGGGGERFLAFVREELIPFIDREYRTKQDDRAYMGHSAGGMFGLHTLFHHPDTFNRYILLAPPLSWDNELVFADEQAYADQNRDLRAKVYLGVGTLDEPVDDPLFSKVIRFHSILKSRNYEGLDLTLDIIPDIGHGPIRFPGARRGVMAVFDAEPA